MTDFRVDVIIDPAQAGTGAQRVKQELKGIEGAADRLRSRLARTFALIGGGAFLARAIQQTGQFQTAIAEISTLVDTAVFDIGRLEQAALRQSAAFGSDAATQAAALYDIVSAGASDAAEATQTLEAANRLALGGVTDVSTAADGLTSVLNAYGLAASEAADVSDSFFVAVQGGKTTVDQLSASIGRVAPLAATAGVDFAELSSAVAALTSAGISTNESVTGVRAILAAVVKPTSEATKAAERLGIEFNAAALESKGLSGFLEDVIEKTGGSSEQLAQLFTGVEALTPVLAFAGETGEKFNEILENQANRAGITDEAVSKLSNTFGFQFNRVIEGAESAVRELLLPALEAITPVLRLVADNIRPLIFAFAALATVIGVRLAQQAIPRAIGAFRLLTLAIAANPIGALAVAAVFVITKLFEFRDAVAGTGNSLTTIADIGQAAFNVIQRGLEGVIAFFSQFEGITQIFTSVFGEVELTFVGFLRFSATAVDTFVGIFAGGFGAIIEAVKKVPDIFIAIFTGIFNAISERFTNFTNFIIRGINRIGSLVGLDGAIDELEAFRIEAGESFGEIGNSIAEAGINSLQNSTLATDFVNQVVSEADRIAQDRAADNRLIAQANQNNPNVPGTDPNSPIIPGGGTGGAEKQNEVLQRQAALLKEVTGGAAELALKQQDLNALYAQGRISTEQYTAAQRDLNVEVSALDNTFSGGLRNGIDRIIQQTNELGTQISDFVVGAFDQLSGAITNFAKTGEFDVRQFFGSLFEQLLKLATNQLFAQLLSGFGGGGAGGGGGFASLLSGFLPGFQNGTSFNVGGSGGPDSQLVAFRASPNERVDVKTPAQQREDGGGTTVVQAPAPNVMVQITPSDIAGALSGAEGDELIVRGIERNRRSINQTLQR